MNLAQEIEVPVAAVEAAMTVARYFTEQGRSWASPGDHREYYHRELKIEGDLDKQLSPRTFRAMCEFLAELGVLEMRAVPGRTPRTRHNVYVHFRSNPEVVK